jgi:hypothetical protein
MRERLCNALIVTAVLAVVYGGMLVASQVQNGRTTCVPAMHNLELAVRNYYAELGQRAP